MEFPKTKIYFSLNSFPQFFLTILRGGKMMVKVLIEAFILPFETLIAKFFPIVVNWIRIWEEQTLMRIVKHNAINFIYMIISKSTYGIYCSGLMNIKHQHLCMFNQMTTIVITLILSLGHLWFSESQHLCRCYYAILWRH